MKKKRILGLLTAAATLTTFCGVPFSETTLTKYTLTANADEDESGKCGDNLTWEYQSDNKLLIISGTGDMYDYSDTEVLAPWKGLFIDSIVVADGVTSICADAFSWNNLLKEVKLPDSVKSIANDAFCGCSDLTDITLPKGLTSISETAMFPAT